MMGGPFVTLVRLEMTAEEADALCRALWRSIGDSNALGNGLDAERLTTLREVLLAAIAGQRSTRVVAP